MSQDTPFEPTPEYGGAPPAAATASVKDELSAPAQMSPFARLGNIVFSPGEVFEDIRRSPRDWWLPILLLIVIATGVGYVVQYRLNFTPDVMAKSIVDTGLEQQGKTRKDLSEDEKKAVAAQETATAWMFRLGPIVSTIYFFIFFGIATGLYYLLLMIAQGKTTFFRVLSVVVYAYAVPNMVKYLLGVVMAFVQDPAEADPVGFIQNGGLITTSLSFLTSLKAHPVLFTFLSWIDLFSIAFLVLLTIGLSTITVKRLKIGTAAAIAVTPYVLMMLLSVGSSMLFRR